ncbi:L,D-transpeptidase [Levilactobacillus suantsaii]|uniref:Murein L,D-transpeptidase n=1 Tax=Levilactobacillus suantsaii TaxID=2292255 RepID=A0A4Q0VJ30_9LACO|nr:L,D-transpeptidase [Levilactobacillus suantsaii]QMU08115.1 L,D-transpeptidase [Levilactobacillus suantsaii]RXI79027.1 murein L,D-transpeptidase [Levilactobacillus suantsaii]
MKHLRKLLLLVLVVLVAGWGLNHLFQHLSASAPRTSQTTKKSTKSDPTEAKAETINWRKPSEDKAYPNLKAHPNAWLDVNTSRQRVYVKDGNKVLYTMYCSTGTGKKNGTPKGTYHIQAERGKFFYNQNSGEGARYWVSWKDHGIYLFHSVPTDKNGHYIKKEAEQLGKSAASHGCVRLSVSDAKWVYEKIPYGTKVVIH